MHKTATLLLSASLLCTPAPALADPLAEIDSLILSNMQILGNWKDDVPQAAFGTAPELKDVGNGHKVACHRVAELNDLSET